MQKQVIHKNRAQPISLDQFKQDIWTFYKTNKRSFAWRNVDDPYKVVVSEIMLQQTQTYCVEKKFDQFIELFPDFKSLAHAPKHAVIAAWQGLGYNRRALALQGIAQKVMQEHGGSLPNDQEILVTFPGIGKATASSICAFAFNAPSPFIETNIRSVFIHFFFKERDDVHDKELMPLIAESLDHNEPREWYYALMDYGVMLKKTLKNPSRKSKHHTQQSKFEGSDRQIRGMILKSLTRFISCHIDELYAEIPREQSRINKALDQLIEEGFITEKDGELFIA
jgi:A/G-specific adenine glycosylase